MRKTMLLMYQVFDAFRGARGLKFVNNQLDDFYKRRAPYERAD